MAMLPETLHVGSGKAYVGCHMRVLVLSVPSSRLAPVWATAD
eukprot:CAMPEP_0181192576 /NCGR_PEP_ID=MMETSP1096-20121128/13357_1 /TAXON_ID=156174 ORGANISM="Chrysochromulina ericina, Strain CCMP281" /NCGR_SAMPLE_ID=MMETSP1096 /ASSEMBLY_ACC=CAM_ASM_000453 /LENGTH=41 /DNA_ID= /DNA_START= /DNA_END= /DNA_ORIENTATION=